MGTVLLKSLDFLCISYIYCIFAAKLVMTMETTKTTRRKIIDIKSDTFRRLSVMAASHGTNLKKFIETSLDELVEAYDDEALYRYLLQNDPEGLEKVSATEKEAFEKKYSL